MPTKKAPAKKAAGKQTAKQPVPAKKGATTAGRVAPRTQESNSGGNDGDGKGGVDIVR